MSIFEDNLIKTVRRFCHKSEIFDEDLIISYQDKILKLYKNQEFDFKSYRKLALTFPNTRKRLFFTYKKAGELFSIEEVLTKALEQSIREKAKIKSSKRDITLEKMIKTLKKIEGSPNFTIISFDFKNFFETISSEFVYENYLKDIDFSKQEKELLKSYVATFPHCMQGLCLSGLFADLIGRDFSEKIKIAFKNMGIICYQHYVDDCIIILNKNVEKEVCLDVINKIINNFNNFGGNVLRYCNKLKLNKNKTSYISALDTCEREFDYLKFKIKINSDNFFKYGINEVKRNEFITKVQNYIIKFNSQPAKLQCVLELFSKKLCYSYFENNVKKWKFKGFLFNYQALRYVESCIDDQTKFFLKNFYEQCYLGLGLNMPSFLKNGNKKFDLYVNLINNVSIKFSRNNIIDIDELKKLVKIFYPNLEVGGKGYNKLIKLLFAKI